MYKRALLSVTALSIFCALSSIACSRVDHGSPMPLLPTNGTFDPTVNGFSFPNYGALTQGSDLTTAEMLRLFGSAVCVTQTGDSASSCQLTTQATAWMNQTNESMSGGHCEGFAVLSVLMQRGAIRPSSFAAGAANAFALPMGNDPLQRELALWWATQAVPSLLESHELTAAMLIAALQAIFQADSDEALTLAIFKNPEYEGGHAVTPIAVTTPVDGDTNAADISIYDNNYSGMTRTISITDLSTGAWSYVAAQQPDEPPEVYSGNDAANPLLIRLVTPRLMLPTVCTFCGSYVPPATMPLAPDPTSIPMPPTGNYIIPRRQIATNGTADLLLTDGMGRQLGLSHGALVNDIPGAAPMAITGIDPFVQTTAPRFLVPEGIALMGTLTPTATATGTLASIDLFGAGYAMGVEGFTATPTTTDTVTFAATGPAFLYTTEQPDSPALVISVQGISANYAFSVQTHGGASGETVALELDAANGNLYVVFGGSSSATYAFDLLLERQTTAGTIQFTHSAVPGPGASTVVVSYGPWTADGTPILFTTALASDPGSPTMVMQPDESTAADGGI